MYFEIAGSIHAVSPKCNRNRICKPNARDVEKINEERYGQLVWLLLAKSVPFVQSDTVGWGGRMSFWGRDLDMEVKERLKFLLVVRHNIELSAVPPAR